MEAPDEYYKEDAKDDANFIQYILIGAAAFSALLFCFTKDLSPPIGYVCKCFGCSKAKPNSDGALNPFVTTKT